MRGRQNLVVERSIEPRAADAMRKPACRTCLPVRRARGAMSVDRASGAPGEAAPSLGMRRTSFTRVVYTNCVGERRARAKSFAFAIVRKTFKDAKRSRISTLCREGRLPLATRPEAPSRSTRTCPPA